MKRLVAVLVFSVCAGAALSAQGMSFGLGVSLPTHFTSFSFTHDGFGLLDNLYNDPTEPNFSIHPDDWAMTTTGFGMNIFFDGFFLEMSFGVLFGKLNRNVLMLYEDDLGWEEYNSYSDDRITMTNLTLALFFKLPINLKVFSLFPMLGFEAYINVGAKDDGKKIDDEWFRTDLFNNAWIKAGLGADIYLTNTMYLRTIFLYGIRFNTFYEDSFKNFLDNDLGNYWGSDTIKSIIGHGMDLRFAIGFRL